jgi:hypothetical protein
VLRVHPELSSRGERYSRYFMPELTTLEAIDRIEEDRGGDAARRLNAAAAILAAGVLTDSAAEHSWRSPAGSATASPRWPGVAI